MQKKSKYRQLDDDAVENLRALSKPLLGTVGKIQLPADTVYSLAMEIIDLRDEVFRLQLCETVDEIIASELDEDEYFLTAYTWNSDPLLSFYDDEVEPSSGVHKPALPDKDTSRLPKQEPADSREESHGRRMAIPSEDE